MNNEKNPFTEYVHECLKLITICEAYELVESKKLEISVRVSPGTIRLLNELSKILDQRLPDLITELITTSAQQLAKAYSEASGDKGNEVYNELMSLSHTRDDDLE